MEPSFIDIFSLRLASMLVGHDKCNQTLKETCPSTGPVAAGKKRRRNNPGRMYWRTPLLDTAVSCGAPSKGGDDENSQDRDTSNTSTNNDDLSASSLGEIFFVDVTFDFVAGLAEDRYDCGDARRSERGTKESIPRVNVRFGALVRSHPLQPASTSGIFGTTGSDKCCSFSTTTNASSFGLSSSSKTTATAVYIKTEPLTKKYLETYATELDIDLDETGPIGMADLLATALQSPPSQTIRVHTQQERGGVLSASIALYHADAMEWGNIRFCDGQSIKELVEGGGYVGESALQMLLSNLDRDVVDGGKGNLKFEKEVCAMEQQSTDKLNHQAVMHSFGVWWNHVTERHRLNANHREIASADKYILPQTIIPSDTLHSIVGRDTEGEPLSSLSTTSQIVLDTSINDYLRLENKEEATTVTIDHNLTNAVTDANLHLNDDLNKSISKAKTLDGFEDNKQRVIKLKTITPGAILRRGKVNHGHAMINSTIRSQRKRKRGKIPIGKMV